MKTKLLNSERNYGLDLLKIVSILFVILLHYNNNFMGGLLEYAENGSINYYIARITEAFAIIACNVFVMITGYYLCNDNKIKCRKITDILLLLIFYGLVIYIFAISRNITTFNIGSIKVMLKTINSRWFIDIYLLLYILHPFINKVIHNISKKQFKLLIGICIFFFSLWSSLLRPTDVSNLTQFVSDAGYGITNFVMLYLIGSYIKLYKDDYQPNKFLFIMIYILLSVINGFLSIEYIQSFQYNFIINVVSTVILFLVFKNLKIKRGQYLSKVASTSLAVYIIHENSFIVKYLYQNIYMTNLYHNSSFLIPHMFITVLSIFTICAIIEIIRKFLFEKTINKLLNKIKILNKSVEI